MDIIFLVMMLGGIIVAAVSGNVGEITSSLVSSANSAVAKVFGFMGVMTFWLGMANIAEKSGLLQTMSRMVRPFLKILFPSIPKDHPAMGAILMNLSANVLGFGSAATPFGLKAMEELQKLNPHKDTASEAMCTFLAINTSSVTLVPATIIGLRAAAGSRSPGDIMSTTLFATVCSTIAAIVLDYLFRRFSNPQHRRGGRRL